MKDRYVADHLSTLLILYSLDNRLPVPTFLETCIRYVRGCVYYSPSRLLEVMSHVAKMQQLASWPNETTKQVI